MLVSELMTAPVRTCRPTDPLSTAARLMWENDIGLVPVLDDSNQVVATVTDRDLCMGAYTQGRALTEVSVRECMSNQVLTVREDQTLEEALQTMAEGRVRRLPVVDGEGHVLGLIALSDAARAVARQSDLASQQGLLGTLLAVGTPHGNAVPDMTEAAVELQPAKRAAAQQAAPKAAAAKKKTATKAAASTTKAETTSSPAKKKATRAVKKSTTRKKSGR